MIVLDLERRRGGFRSPRNNDPMGLSLCEKYLWASLIRLMVVDHLIVIENRRSWDRNPGPIWVNGSPPLTPYPLFFFFYFPFLPLLMHIFPTQKLPFGSSRIPTFGNSNLCKKNGKIPKCPLTKTLLISSFHERFSPMRLWN